jgi:hypothetical protein
VLLQPAAGGVMRHVVGGRYGLGSKDYCWTGVEAADSLRMDFVQTSALAGY